MNETNNINGKWTISADAMGQAIQIEMNLTQTDDKIAGTLSSMLGGGTIEDGKVSGNNITGTAKISVQGQAVDLKMTGTVDGDSMKGTLDSPFGVIPFTAKKAN